MIRISLVDICIMLEIPFTIIFELVSISLTTKDVKKTHYMRSVCLSQ